MSAYPELQTLPNNVHFADTVLPCASSEEIFETILHKMLERSTDRYPAIRSSAVNALCRLQNPTDEEDLVVKQYLRLLATDSHK